MREKRYKNYHCLRLTLSVLIRSFAPDDCYGSFGYEFAIVYASNIDNQIRAGDFKFQRGCASASHYKCFTLIDLLIK